MDNNIGKSIKTLAIVGDVVGTVISIIFGFNLMFSDEDLILTGFLVMILGCFISWAFFLLVQGFGDLVENVSNIEYNLRASKGKKTTSETVDTEKLQRLNNLKSLFDQGLITEEEYQQAISKDQ